MSTGTFRWQRAPLPSKGKRQRGKAKVVKYA